MPHAGPGMAPGIIVQFIRPDGTLSDSTPALIDTGSDFTHFPATWGVDLGVDPTELIVAPSEQNLDLVTPEKVMPKRWPPGIEVEVLGRRVRVAAIFDPRTHMPILLGRDFLAYFEFKVDEHAELLSLRYHGRSIE